MSEHTVGVGPEASVTHQVGRPSITDFLLARIAEEELDARYVVGHPEYDGRLPGRLMRKILRECEAKRRIIDEHARSPLDATEVIYPAKGKPYDLTYPACQTCVMDDPQRHPLQYPCPTIRALAAVYADHADYDPEWGTP